MNDVNIIQLYISDINSSLRDASTEDIMLLFRKLCDKEQDFAKKLQSTASGRKVYLNFIQKIVDSKGGIKIARSYFRARQDTYLNTVNKAIKDVNPKLMFNVPINYKFCCFAIEEVVKTISDKKPNKSIDKLKELFNEIKGLREEIINKHLYLSLNRAKVHSNSAHAMSFELEDLIQISNEALIIAVDKYVMDDDSSSFHQMAIGRMISKLIVDGTNISSATIGQHAQKKLYQIRKLLQKQPGANTGDIAKALDIAEEEIAELLSATSYRSMDDTVSEDSDVRFSEIMSSPEDESAEEKMENNDLLLALRKSFSVLSLFEKKVLILKGVKIDG